MMTLMRDGGFPMWFILAFGLVALGAAVRFAVRGVAQPLGFIKGMMGATLFATLSGTGAALGAVFVHISSGCVTCDASSRVDAIASDPHRFDHMLLGFGESMSAGIVGFSLLALTAMLLAVGSHRSGM